MPETDGSGSAEGDGRPSFLRIVSGAGMLTSSRIGGDLASALLFIAVSRAFGVEGIGLYAYAFAIAQIAQLLVNYGLDDYGLREYASTPPPERGRILANALVLQCGLLGIVALGLWLYLFATGAEPLAATLIWMLAAYQILTNFGIMLFIPAISAQRMGAPALVEGICRVGGTLVAAALVVWAGTGILASLAVLPVAALVMVIAAVGIARRFNGPIGLGLQRRVAEPILRSALSFAVSSLIFGLFAKVGLILLAFFQGKAAAGIFAVGLKLVDLGMAPLFLLGVAVFPRLASSFASDHRDFAEIAEQYLRLSIVLGSLVLWGMVFVVPPLLPILLGPDFVAAQPAVQLMGVLALLNALDFAAARLLWSLRLQNLRLRIQLIGLAVNIVLNLALIPWLAVTGAILAGIFSFVVTVSLAIAPVVRRMPSAHWRRVGRACVLPAAAGLAAGAGVTILALAPWLGAAVTLCAFAGAAMLSGLAAIDQLKLAR